MKSAHKRKYRKPTLISVSNDIYKNRIDYNPEPQRTTYESEGDRFLREEEQIEMNCNYWYFLGGFGIMIMGFFIISKFIMYGIIAFLLGAFVIYIGWSDWQKVERKRRKRYGR